jgi:oligoribonuclease (3'-5' exoribonuclease)
MKQFMIDIETMGLDPRADDVLQIGIVELVKGGDIYRPGKTFQLTLFTEQEPKNEWIRENHKDLLVLCKEKGSFLPPELVREYILRFFRECGVTDKPVLVGLNLMSLDVPFLVEKGYLKKEDFHYRVNELTGAINQAVDVLNVDRETLFVKANDAVPEIVLPMGKKHEALYDCFSQLKLMNGMIRLLRRGMSV